MVEIWVDITGYNGNYMISNLGNIKNKEGKLMKCCQNRGYKIISLSLNGVKKQLKVHRLIAIEFIENIYDKPQINHINGIRNDNRLENLEWCTSQENMMHRRDVLGYKHSDITLLKILESRKNYKHSDEAKRKIAEANKRRIVTDITKLKISIANKEINRLKKTTESAK